MLSRSVLPTASIRQEAKKPQTFYHHSTLWFTKNSWQNASPNFGVSHCAVWKRRRRRQRYAVVFPSRTFSSKPSLTLWHSSGSSSDETEIIYYKNRIFIVLRFFSLLRTTLSAVRHFRTKDSTSVKMTILWDCNERHPRVVETEMKHKNGIWMALFAAYSLSVGLFFQRLRCICFPRNGFQCVQREVARIGRWNKILLFQVKTKL